MSILTQIKAAASRNVFIYRVHSHVSNDRSLELLAIISWRLKNNNIRLWVLIVGQLRRFRFTVIRTDQVLAGSLLQL